jgi:ferrous iron transport protein A
MLVVVTLATAPFGIPLVLGEAALPAPRRLRLAELGLRNGVTITVLRRTAGGGRILGVGDARIALGRGILSRVIVSPMPSPARPAQPAGRSARRIAPHQLPTGAVG